MARNDLKAYETLTARIPQALVDAARRYASEHHCTVSDMIRDSLQMYLDGDGVHRREQEVLRGQTEVLQEGIREVIQEVLRGQTTGAPLEGHTEVRHEVRHGHTSLEQAIVALPVKGHTEVRHDANSPAVVSTEVLQGQTTEATSEGLTSVIQGHAEVLPPEEVLQGNTEEGSTEVLPFDPVKYRLGKLCKAGHDYHGTGQSLRRNNKAGYCLACNAEDARARRQAKRQEVSA